MKNKLAQLKNIAAYEATYHALANAEAGLPCMGLVIGATGAGKSTGTAALVNRNNGVYVRARATWTPNSMLAAIMSELGAEPLQRSSRMMDYISQQLLQSNRPLFVDEANYIAHSGEMLESLRDIHDEARVPVVLIGHDGTERKIANRAQLMRRITHTVEFKPADLEDAQILARTICEIELDAELVEALHDKAAGSVGLMTVGLSRIEALAKTNGWKQVDAEQWGNRPFFTGQAPTAKAARARA
jgi:DNA transposition AAA+ family ATPase